MNKQKIIKLCVIYPIEALIAFLVYYFTLPAMNLQSKGFWVFLSFILFLALAPIFFFKGELLEKINKLDNMLSGKLNGNKKKKKTEPEYYEPKSGAKKTFIAVGVVLLPLVVLLLGVIVSSTVFNARAYASVINVQEADFGKDMPETSEVTNIALMDTDTAQKIASRTLGSLSDMVSQYELSDYCNQINFRRTPQKVTNLEYADFFKWIGNKANGIPGYVMVDPVNNTATYKELETPLKYVESGFFGDDLMRKVRFMYPTKILGEARFEVNDDGKPFFIIPCYKPQVLMFGAEDVYEVIVFDPCAGVGELYKVSEAPAWIDCVFDGYLALEKYDWKGLLSGGFINSIIGNKDCKQTPDDFGYIVIEDDVWYYTGVTSVNSDMSNIGFIISNARTGQYKFYSVIGAEEHSAMSAAEGEVQEKGYEASFPALINVSGKATYIMVLKDAGGLVKLYALVNVEKYSIVATGETQQKAMQKYKELLIEDGIINKDDLPPSDDTVETDITIEGTQIIALDGNSYIYIFASYENERCIFKASVSENEALLLAEVGDILHIKATPTDTARIFDIVKWSLPKE